MKALLLTRLSCPLRLVTLGCVLVCSSVGCSPHETSASLQATKSAAENAETRTVRAARAAQNRAIAALDTATVASFWTEDVEIRRGLGALVVGRDAYKQLFNSDSAAIASGKTLIYQREPANVIASETWPLAYEEGTWIGHLGRADGPVLISGRYAAQWVKRNGRWLIRGEVYVALTCAAAGCALSAVP